MVAEDGILGLYAGINGALLGVASTNFAYFYWYSFVRDLYFKSKKVATPPSTATELVLGAIAGAIAQAFTIPVAVVTTRQQTQAKAERKGLIETAREIIDGEDGPSGLWRGLKASLVLVVNPAITYGAYERLKTTIFPNKTRLTPGEAFSESINPIGNLFSDFCNLSARCYVQGAGYHCDPASYCRQGRPAVQASAATSREALQGLHRGDAVYRPTRRSSWPLQGYRSTNLERPIGPGYSHDDKRTVWLP